MIDVGADSVQRDGAGVLKYDVQRQAEIQHQTLSVRPIAGRLQNATGICYELHNSLNLNCKRI